MTEFDLYYKHFQENAVDTERAAVYDAILSDPEMPDQLKEKLMDWKRTLSTIKNMGETMSKSLSVSFMRFVMMTPAEQAQAKRMGELHNALMRNKERG